MTANWRDSSYLPNNDQRATAEAARLCLRPRWDTSEDAKVWAKLPDEVDVLDMDIDLSKYDPSKDLDYDNEFLDDVSEWLTSHYDFCHDGFDIVTK